MGSRSERARLPKPAPVLTDSPAQMVTSWVDMSMLVIETQAVVWMRLMGMAGLWSVPATETRRMIAEKPAAFTESLVAGATAGVRGASPAEVVSATIIPLRQRTRKNARRLARRGPKLTSH